MESNMELLMGYLHIKVFLVSIRSSDLATLLNLVDHAKTLPHLDR